MPIKGTTKHCAELRELVKRYWSSGHSARRIAVLATQQGWPVTHNTVITIKRQLGLADHGQPQRIERRSLTDADRAWFASGLDRLW